MSDQQFPPAIEEFLAELAKSPREWRFDGFGRIRFGRDALFCPLEEEYERRTGKWAFNFIDVGVKMGLRDGEPLAVAKAADNDPFHNHALRARILEACGLTEALP